MTEMFTMIAAFALVAAGAIVGLLVLFAVGIHREEKARSLGVPTPGGIASGLRAVTDTRVRERVPQFAGHR